MKRYYEIFMKRSFITFLFFVLPLVASAETIEIDGIYYNLSEKDHQANVTVGPNKYQGDVTIPESVTYEGVNYVVSNIGEKAFYRCYKLTSVTLPKSVIFIDDEAFCFSGLTFINIPQSVTAIGKSAFYGCIDLTHVIVSNGVNSLGSFAFEGCSYLKSIYVDTDEPIDIEGNVFSNRADITLYVPKGKKSEYEAAEYWSDFRIVESPGDVNGDGIIDTEDAVCIVNYFIGKPNKSFLDARADYDNDGEIDIADAVQTVNYVVDKTNADDGTLDGTVVTITPDLKWENNKKITNEGIVCPYIRTVYSCSNPIEVFAGDIVEVTAKSHSSASILSRCRENGSGVYDIRGRDNVVEPLVVAADGSEHVYTVSINEHCYIMVCVVLSDMESVIIKREIAHNIDVENYVRTKYGDNENLYDGDLPFNENSNSIKTYFADNKIGSGTSISSNYIVNAVAYPNGEIIACRNGGAVVKIMNDGTEVPIQYNGADMVIQNASDWRGVFISKNNDVFISPHSSLGKGYGTPNGTTNQINEVDRGLYRIAYGSTTASKVLNLFNNAPVMVVMWVENTAYTVGKIVWYINHCYKCNIAHTSGSTFDASKFERMPSWKQNEAYKAGDIIQCNNNDYECMESHTSGSTWDPAEQNKWVAAASCMEGQHDTIWSICEDDKGDLYAGVYAHFTRRQPVIYKSHDRGIHWRYIYNFATNADVGIPGDWPIVQGPRHIHGITFNEFDNCLYCACGETNTLWKSSDYGSHWEDLKCAGYEGKPTSVIGVPGGVVMGSDGQWGCAITKVLNDGKTAKLVGKIWASFIFNIRRSDRTGWLYAFSRLDNVIQNKGVGTSCPPVEAMTDASVLDGWVKGSDQNTIAAWKEHNAFCSKYYPEDAIIPHHAAIMVSKDDGDSWEILRYEDVGTNGNSGFLTVGYFRNGECLTGLISDNGRESGNNIYVQPVVISEGESIGEIFVKTNITEQ